LQQLFASKSKIGSQGFMIHQQKKYMLAICTMGVGKDKVLVTTKKGRVIWL